MKHQELPLPEFFDAGRVDQVWRVPYQERARQAREWAARHGIAAAAADRRRICLLCIDVQNTFCLPEFELFVAGSTGLGAVEDSARLCRFLYRNLRTITAVRSTLDTHAAMQIFHPVFWVDQRGEYPPPFTAISAEEVERGVWSINPEIAPHWAGFDGSGLREHALHYTRKLKEAGRHPLVIWPYHAMLGGIGHALVAAVEEAIFFHGIARNSPAGFQLKGRHPATENYSVLRPEVLDTSGGRQIAGKNKAFIDELLSYDVLIVAGQAKSHCVAWTVEDLLAEIQALDPALARKIYLLEDCTSPVVVPGSDFTESANAAFHRFAEAGMHRVRSVHPIESWPDIE